MASRFPYGDTSVRRSKLKLCDCGCGAYPRGGDYMPGHEMQVFRALVDHVGSVINLREVVEQYTGKTLDMSAIEASVQAYNFKSVKDKTVKYKLRKYK
jgi:hypothetical protein